MRTHPAWYHWYQTHARQSADRYESIPPETLHSWLQGLLPTPSSRILDVGAGSGRDAAWLAGLGYEVVAVEPCSAMRAEAKRRHPGLPIQWRVDRLPSLKRLSGQEPFDLILLSAVWMHLPESNRRRAFLKLISLLKPQGTLAFTLRHGEEIPERGIHAVSLSELETLARDHGAMLAHTQQSDDHLGRADVCWSQIAIRFPDNGTGSLPLVRHIILKQNKSATHKLALLRTLCRIADGAVGMARANHDETVSIPMGLVALTWLRLFKPLLAEGLPQRPSNQRSRGLGFVREAYRAIEHIKSLDLRIGMHVRREDSAALHQALKDAMTNIITMPVAHMTYPNGGPIVQVIRPKQRPRRPESIELNEPYLFSFGEMKVPEHLWQAFRANAIWVEPAMIAKWSEMMLEYAAGLSEPIPDIENKIKQAMVWADPTRDVQLSRKQALRLLEHGPLHCVWSGKKLRQDHLDIDHCLPWSLWSCDDLWNLMPAHRSVNLNKRDHLPSDEIMDAAQDRIQGWWEQAYLSAPQHGLEQQFFLGARSSLPGVQSKTRSLDQVFESVCLQRQKLKRDQQAPEWEGYS